MKRGKTTGGFTLIELIVVIAIIGVLAAILVPSMLGYAKTAKIREYNSNAATVFKGAQLACVDIATGGGVVLPDTVYVNSVSGDGQCSDSSGNIMDITDYVGSEFDGYFGFMTDSGGSGCVYAMWSSEPITDANLQTQMSMSDIKSSFDTLPIGCHPQRN